MGVSVKKAEPKKAKDTSAAEIVDKFKDGDIFPVLARRCQRCGRLLTSTEAVATGYGCQCMKKEQQEAAGIPPFPGQIGLFEEEEKREEKKE